jgi:SPP1 family phage portal protein
VVKIYTYNDLTDIGQNEQQRMEFVLSAIREHKGSDLYKTAYDAELYYKHQNPTIMRYQKYVYNAFGAKVPDIWSPNNKIASNWYNYFTTQAVSYLLGNGVTFGKKEATKDKLGKDFDKRVQDCATAAKNGGIGFGFWNYDHLEVFKLTEFVPLYDEDDGGLKAGIRFWQIDDQKPLRATLYELDGYTDYIKRKDEEVTTLHEKRAYKQIIRKSEVEGETILDGENYPGFPIVPLWNVNRQSDLVGNRGTIDAYDLMVSGLINNVNDGEFIYWILKNCGAMNPEDDVKFLEQLKLTHVAHADGDDAGASVEAHNVSVEFEASAEALDRLTAQLYADFMALKVQDLSAGNKTATEITAAYEPINQKTDQFEYCVTDFIQGILELAGIEDEPTYTRSQMSNQSEMLEMVLQCAEYLDEEYVTTKILTLLGDADKAQEVLKRKDAEAADRYKQQEAELEELRNQQNNEPVEE